jgi:uncharacterized damage-inducible protein DinB
MQVAEETPEVLEGLSADQIWARPGGAASIGFHIAHLAGSLDRLVTYSRGEGLSGAQQDALAAERIIDDTRPGLTELLQLLERTVNAALQHLQTVSTASLATPREVGRARLPSTTLGLLFHAAEHSVRHGGQIITMVKVVTP